MTGKEERLVVSLNGGGPWGFRLQGGAGTGLPLIVSKVRRKSKAYKRLREGDRILSVNGRPCNGLTYDQLMDIADKSGTDLTLEIIRRECDKENLAPRQESSTKITDNSSATKELSSFTETSTKISKEEEGLRIKSVTVVPESTGFEAFTSSKLDEKPPEKSTAEAAVEPFPSFQDLKAAQSASDACTSSKQEVVTGDDKNFTKTIVETKHEVKDGAETSFFKKEQQSVSKTESDASPHGMPDITLDTIDLNNLISETQKRLDSFRNGFKTDGIFDNSLPDIKTTGGGLFDNSAVSETSKRSGVTSIVSSESKTAEASNLKSTTETSLQQQESASLVNKEPEVSKLPDPVKKIPPPTLPKPKIKSNPPCFDAFKDCLKEMEMDPIFSLPDIGFDSQSSDTTTVTTDIPFGTCTSTTTKKKKMFSSSSFYEEPHAIYPTMEEQFEMARKIADSLADDTNKKSKGANMFYKRVKRSSKWIHEGPEPSDDSAPGTPEVQGVEPPTPDPSQVPFRPSKGPPKLKLVLDPRHTLDLNALRSGGFVISEHNVVSPEVCHGLVKDLQSPVGKGAALFAKRKKKSEEWVVDEEKVKALMREQERRIAAPPLSTSPAFNQYPTIGRQDVKLVKSPWEAAMENPYGFCDAAFRRVNPDQLADTVMKRADYKRAESLSRESSRMEGCLSPAPAPPFTSSAGGMYDIYRPKPPKGWMGGASPAEYFPQPAAAAPSPAAVTSPPPTQQVRNMQNGFQTPRKMVFQNFNTVPRIWKGASVR